MLAHSRDAGFLVAVHKRHAKSRHFLWVIAMSSHAKRLISCIRQDIQTWAHDQVNTTCSDFFSGSFCNLIGQFSRSCRRQTHCRRVLANVDVVEEAVDAAILLIKANGKRHWVAGIMRSLLELVDQLCCLFSRCHL